jgi:predicted permease
VQVAVCLVLLLSAGLLARGLYRADTIDPGLGMETVSVVAFDLRGAGYTPAAASAFERRLIDRLSAMSGVSGVALTTAVPLSDQHSQTAFSIDGSDNVRHLEFSQVSSTYFDLLGLRIVRGRNFVPSEIESERAAIVTESTARRLWPGEDPLTKALTLDRIARPVVGVVRDAQVSRLGQSDSSYVFLPVSADVRSASHSSSAVTLDEVSVLIAGTPTTPSPRELTEAVRAIDPDLAVDVTRLAANLEQWRAPSLLVSSLSAALALLALVLALTGVFGTVAYAVSRRVREIGIRVALGAARRDVLRLMVRQGMRPVAIGIVLGIAGSALASTWFKKMLYGLSPHDPASFVLVPVGFFVVALAACYLPARRALKVEPTVALRAE